MGRRSFLFALLAAISLLASPSFAAQPEGNPAIVVFYEEGCPGCETVEELIGELAADLPPSSIVRYEISDPNAFDLLTRLAAAFEIEFDSVPVVFVGEEAIVGSGRSAEFGLRAAIGDCVVRGCPSPFDRIRPPPFPWADILKLVAFVALVALLAVLQPL